MSLTFNLAILLTLVHDLQKALKSRKESSREALGLVNNAYIQTYDYLNNNLGEYQPNIELANLWNTAAIAVMKIDQLFGNMLFDKSRFWTYPDVFIALNRQEEVIDLDSINDQMQRMIRLMSK